MDHVSWTARHGPAEADAISICQGQDLVPGHAEPWTLAVGYAEPGAVGWLLMPVLMALRPICLPLR